MASIAIGMLSLGDPRKLLDMVPDHIKKTWNNWVLQGLISLSVFSQILLVLLGNLRKHNPRTGIRIILWCSYLLTTAVASAALGIITQTAVNVCTISPPISQYQKLNTSDLMSFWASFLLLHLGGPDTITAYSLEDNELWVRQLAELILQSAVALYILLLSWPGCSDLPLLSVLVSVAGFIKCYERVQALRLASTEHIRDSTLGCLDPGPDYTQILKAFHLEKSQGFVITAKDVPDAPLPPNDHAYPEGGGEVISKAYDLFRTFKPLFVGLIPTIKDRGRSQSFFRHLKPGKTFSTVEIELGFAYDMLYTKAGVVYTFAGLMIRGTGIFLVLMVALGFSFFWDTDDTRVVDIAITYLLLATAVIMEIYAVVSLLRSDWTDYWLGQHGYTRNILIFPFLKHPTKRRWSNSIAQLDLLSVALEEKPARFLHAQRFFGVDKYRVNRYKTYSHVSDNLKDLIYTQFHEFLNCSSDPKALCSLKGSFSLQKNDCNTLLWSITEVEFDQSLLIWHIATDLCYYSELEDKDDDDHRVMNVHRTESKYISDYLLYLLMSYPVMLPIGIGIIRCRDTCAEAMRFFKEKGPIVTKVEACRKLLEVGCTALLPRQVKGGRSKSVLFDGCRLALTLREMERERMWKVMSEVLIEILAYGATHCRGVRHAQQLQKGGEFLTHVWLLMAHLGITEQSQLSQGHARARFKVS